jgi:hypothetical protein
MQTLADRFREVELILNSLADLPQALPPSWMQVNTAATVVRFIESNFNEERTIAEIQQIFSGPRNVTFTPMSLRSIFLATAKARRGSKEQGA